MELDDSKPERRHWMSLYRDNYLRQIFNKLQELLNEHNEMCNNKEWYDGDFWHEDREETLGFAFLACQIFITGSIMDSLALNPKLLVTGNIDKEAKQKFKKAISKAKAQSMKNAPLFLGLRTKIELINAVANYYKHKDEGELEETTKQIFKDYKLLEKDFPINEAFNLINEDDQLDTLLLFLTNWSNHIYNTLDLPSS